MVAHLTFSIKIVYLLLKVLDEVLYLPKKRFVKAGHGGSSLIPAIWEAEAGGS